MVIYTIRWPYRLFSCYRHASAREDTPVRTRSTHQRRTTGRQHLYSTSPSSRSSIEAPVRCRRVAEALPKDHAARQKLRPRKSQVHVLPSSVLSIDHVTCLLRANFVRFRTVAVDKANTRSQSPGRYCPKLHTLSKGPALFPGTKKPNGLIARN